MLTLYGFALSNYYNKVKLALLEKDVPFAEELVYTNKDAIALGSPLGKIPFLKTPQGIVCESTVILEYLEEQYPQKPLLPSAPYDRALVRELLTMLDLYLELVARELYPEAFFNGKVSDEVKASVEKRLEKNIPAFMKLAKFAPYVAGAEMTFADCAAVFHFRLLSLATTRIYGRNFLKDTPVAEYMDKMAERPTMQKILADSKSNQEVMEKLGAKPKA